MRHADAVDSLDADRPVIHVYHASKKYGDHYALRDVTLELANGEFVFLVGPSGAGKSTLLRLITMEDVPTEGQVVVGPFISTRKTRRTLPKLRRTLGMIYQDFRLLDDLNVHENIALPLRVTGRSTAEIKKFVMEVMMQVGLYAKRNDRPPALSGGEQQRVAIARALVGSPRILLADEPTGNLDPEVTREVLKLLLRINASGTAVLMATHDHTLVHQDGQRVIVLKDGAIESEKLTVYPVRARNPSPPPPALPRDETYVETSEPVLERTEDSAGGQAGEGTRDSKSGRTRTARGVT